MLIVIRLAPSGRPYLWLDPGTVRSKTRSTDSIFFVFFSIFGFFLNIFNDFCAKIAPNYLSITKIT